MRHSKQKWPRFSFSSPRVCPQTDMEAPITPEPASPQTPFFNQHQCTWPSLQIAFGPPNSTWTSSTARIPWILLGDHCSLV
jgi:hypothetical protein